VDLYNLSEAYNFSSAKYFHADVDDFRMLTNCEYCNLQTEFLFFLIHLTISSMIGFYYRIWFDCITRINLQSDENKKNWQITCTTAMTFAMASNFILIMVLVQKYGFGYYFYRLDLSSLPKKFASVLNFTLLYLLPCLLVNYVLIFKTGDTKSY